MFVATPSMRNSHSARYARCTTSVKLSDDECAMTFASSESKLGEVRYPA